jgi:hypothetical protein
MYLYICVDPWEVGRVRLMSSASLWEAARRYVDAELNQEVFVGLFGCLLRILEQRTNVCAICV